MSGGVTMLPSIGLARQALAFYSPKAPGGEMSASRLDLG